VASRDEDLLVRERDRFAGAQRRERGPKTRDPGARDEHQIDVVARGKRVELALLAAADRGRADPEPIRDRAQVLGA